MITIEEPINEDMNNAFQKLQLDFINKDNYTSFLNYLKENKAYEYYVIWKELDGLKNKDDTVTHEIIFKIYNEYLKVGSILNEFKTEGLMNLITGHLSKIINLDVLSLNDIKFEKSIISMIKAECSEILHKFGREYIRSTKMSFLKEEKKMKIEIMVIFDNEKKANVSIQVFPRTQIKQVLKTISNKLGIKNVDEFALRKLDRDEIFETDDRMTMVYQSEWLEKEDTLKKCKIVDYQKLICIQRQFVFNLSIHIPCIYKKIEYECNTMTSSKSLVSTIMSKEKQVNNIGLFSLISYTLPKFESGEKRDPPSPITPHSPSTTNFSTKNKSFTLSRSFSKKLNGSFSDLGTLNNQTPKNKDFPFVDKEEKMQQFKTMDLKRTVFVISTKEEYLSLKYDFWVTLQCDWDNCIKNKRDLVKKMVRKGVPYFMREKIWPLMLGAIHLADSNPGLYEEYLLKQMENGDTEDTDRLVIIKDINRTFPKHKFFSKAKGMGQNQLRNVLEAFHYSNRELGYCQGMNFVTGIFLIHMPEEEAYWCLDRIINGKLNLMDMFKVKLPLLNECVYRFKIMVQQLAPNISEQIDKQQHNCTLFAMSWFHCLFSQKFQLSLVVRIWDILFFEQDFSIIFRTAIALLKLNYDKIFNEDKDVTLYNLLNLHLHCQNNEDQIIQAAAKIKKVPEMKLCKGVPYFTDKKKEDWNPSPSLTKTNSPTIFDRAKNSFKDLENFFSSKKKDK